MFSLRVLPRQNFQTAAPLGFVSPFHRGNNLRGHFHAQVGADQSRFQLFSVVALSLGERVTTRLISCASLL